MGLKGGVYSYVFNWDQIQYQQQKDALNIGGKTQTLVPDADAGVYFTSSNFYSGVSVTHILARTLRSNDNIIAAESGELDPHLLVMSGMSFRLGDELIFNPSVLVKATMHTPVAFDVNLNFLISSTIWLGASLRKGYGIVFLTKYNINENFKVGYAYDLGLSDLGKISKGSHELVLQYDLRLSPPSRKVRARF